MRPPFLHSGKRLLIQETELHSILDEITQAILIRNANFNKQNSGLVLDDILNFRFKITEFNPLSGRGYQELPEFLARKRAKVNVNNSYWRCFGYAVLSAIERVPIHPDRVTH